MFLCLVATIVFKFNGGSPGQLATNLSDYLKHPVVILLDEPRQIRRFTVSEEEAKLFNTYVFKWTSYSGGGVGGYAPKAWPLYMKRSIYPDNSFLELGVSRLALKKEQDLFVVPPQDNLAHSIRDFTTQSFSRRVTIHPTLDRGIVALSAGKFSEDKLMEAAATALGAKLVTTSAEFRLEFDPKQYRSRQVAYYEAELAKAIPRNLTNYTFANLKFKIEAYRVVTDAQLLAAANENKEISLQVKPGTPLMKAALDRAASYAQRTDLANAPSSGPGSVSSVVDMVDFDRPLTVEIMLGNDVVHMSGKMKGEKNAGISF